MLMLLVELVAERVKQDPVPVNLMAVLTMVGVSIFKGSFSNILVKLFFVKLF